MQFLAFCFTLFVLSTGSAITVVFLGFRDNWVLRWPFAVVLGLLLGANLVPWLLTSDLSPPAAAAMLVLALSYFAISISTYWKPVIGAALPLVTLAGAVSLRTELSSDALSRSLFLFSISPAIAIFSSHGGEKWYQLGSKRILILGLVVVLGLCAALMFRWQHWWLITVPLWILPFLISNLKLLKRMTELYREQLYDYARPYAAARKVSVLALILAASLYVLQYKTLAVIVITVTVVYWAIPLIGIIALALFLLILVLMSRPWRGAADSKQQKSPKYPTLDLTLPGDDDQ